jgi:hypothetical protein
MPAFELSISVEGDERLDNMLRQCGYRAFNAEPALNSILHRMVEAEEALFATSPWVPNAEATVENKGGSEPLVRTGALRASLTNLGDKNMIAEVTDSTLKFGTRLWYAHFSLGTKTGEPERNPMKIKARDKRAIREIVLNWILEGRAGRTGV